MVFREFGNDFFGNWEWFFWEWIFREFGNDFCGNLGLFFPGAPGVIPATSPELIQGRFPGALPGFCSGKSEFPSAAPVLTPAGISLHGGRTCKSQKKKNKKEEFF